MASVVRKIGKARANLGAREVARRAAAARELRDLLEEHSRVEDVEGTDHLVPRRAFDTEYAAGRASVLECQVSGRRQVVLQPSGAEPGKHEIRLVTGEGIHVLARGDLDDMNLQLRAMLERAREAGQVVG